MKKLLHCLIGFLPLVIVLPHWLTVVMTSPVDRLNLLHWGGTFLVLLIAGLVVAGRRPAAGAARPLFFALYLPVLAAFLAGMLIDIWLISMVAAVAAAFLGTAMLAGRRRGRWFVPAFTALLLAVPGVLYWGERAGELLSGESCPPCELSPRKLADGANLPKDWLAREVALTPGEKALFRTSHVENWNIAVGRTVVGLYEVTLGADVHEVHPPSFCLKSQGFREEKSTKLRVREGDTDLEVEETIALCRRTRVIVWTWYTDEQESTASFIGFRMKARPGWKRYMLVSNDVEGGRKVFEEVISTCRVR